jgi:uncharacterized protein YdhG (YjbR/CyaY superfamily)
MKSDADTAKAEVRAYFAALPPATRKALKTLREVIFTVAPGATEGFSYRIPAYRLDDKRLVWIAAFKNHVSLYPMTGKIRRAFAKELSGYKMSTGTVQFPLDKPIPVALVKKLLRARIKEVQAGA